MSFKQINLDDPEQRKQYKKEKNHKQFLRDNNGMELDPAYETREEPTADDLEIGTNMIAKVVKVDQLRVRKYPEGEVIRLINKGDEVRIICDFDDIWYKVELPDGLIGFCMKTYLMTFEEAPYLDDKSRRCKTNV